MNAKSFLSCLALLCFAVLPCASQGEGEPADLLLDRYLSELDHTGFIRYWNLLTERPKDAQRAIDSRLIALETGNDPYSPKSEEPIGDEAVRREAAVLGAVLVALGRIGAAVGDDDYAQSVWRRAAVLILGARPGIGPESTVALRFIEGAQPNDRKVLEELVEREAESRPTVGISARNRLKEIRDMEKRSRRTAVIRISFHRARRMVVSQARRLPWLKWNRILGSLRSSH